MRKAALLGFVIAIFAFAMGCKGNLKSNASCVPQCSGKECGNDTCGGTCGRCGPGLACSTDGQCVSSFCGNGRLDPGEECDPSIASGAVGACDTEATCVDDGDPCTTETFFGNPLDCDAECRHTAVSNGMCINGDGCCPSGCLQGADSDCSDSCDDSVLDPGETCDPIADCPTEPTDCPDDGDACTNPIVTGNPEACASQCNTEPIEDCVDDDGCCPSDCGVDEDTDCEFVCGDGMVTGPEFCDNMIAAPDEGFCPEADADCDDGEACTTDAFVGMAADCTATCMNTAIVDPVNGDGCCPPGATPDNDDDCMAVCGNAIVEAGETCDNMIPAGDAGACPVAGDCDDAEACTTDALVGDAADCTAECENTAIQAPTADDGCCYFAGTVMGEINDCQSLCDDYCAGVTTFCTDAELGAGNGLFQDMNADGSALDECQAACAAYQFTISQAGSVDFVDDDGFDTMYCRLYHLGLADPGQAGDPVTHCPHVVETSPVCNTAP